MAIDTEIRKPTKQAGSQPTHVKGADKKKTIRKKKLNDANSKSDKPNFELLKHTNFFHIENICNICYYYNISLIYISMYVSVCMEFRQADKTNPQARAKSQQIAL